MAAIIGDERVTRFLSFDARTREQAADMINGTMERATASRRDEFFLAVVPRYIDTVVGFARLALTGHQAAKLGSTVGFEHQGKGYASDAVATLVDFGFSNARATPDHRGDRTGKRS